MSTLNTAAAITTAVGSAVRLESRVLVLWGYKILGACGFDCAGLCGTKIKEVSDLETAGHGLHLKKNHKPFVEHRAGRKTCIAWRHPLCLISLGKVKTRWESDKLDQ